MRLLLSRLKLDLGNLYEKVNKTISEGKNEYFKLTPKRKNPWSLDYPKLDTKEESERFFCNVEQLGIHDILQFVNQRCDFMSAFTHVLKHKSRTQVEESHISACLIAYGTMLGLHKMAGISDLSKSSLVSTSNAFVRLETMKKANDIVVNEIAKLSMFSMYNHEVGVVHSSSDGQKFETKFPTIKSRNSSKYFGLKKGLVGYTLVVNHIPINTDTIGANDHESHYVFDLIHNNTSEVQPNIHSTDTHGVNNVNFLILHTFGYQFAPRYRNFGTHASQNLVGFGDISKYQDKPISPAETVDEKIVIEQWDTVQRIMVSLAMRKTTQSNTIRKLSSRKNVDRTKKAMWMLDSIYKSLYILNYISDASLRQGVQGSLNRGESYHALRRGVSIANKSIPAKTDTEQDIWQECARFLANCIEYYNMVLLSEVLERAKTRDDQEMIERLKHTSPACWLHVNLYGRYTFKNDFSEFDINKIVEILMDN